jgi:hypothetical protein
MLDRYITRAYIALLQSDNPNIAGFRNLPGDPVNGALGTKQYNDINLGGRDKNRKPMLPLLQIPGKRDSVPFTGIEPVPRIKTDPPYIEVMGFQMVLEMIEKRTYRSL